MGESGCGKTTTGKMLLKLYEFIGGQYFFNHQDIMNLRDKAEIKKFKKKAQLMFQNPFEAINPCFTVKKALMEPLLIYHEGK